MLVSVAINAPSSDIIDQIHQPIAATPNRLPQINPFFSLYLHFSVPKCIVNSNAAAIVGQSTRQQHWIAVEKDNVFVVSVNVKNETIQTK